VNCPDYLPIKYPILFPTTTPPVTSSNSSAGQYKPINPPIIPPTYAPTLEPTCEPTSFDYFSTILPMDLSYMKSAAFSRSASGVVLSNLSLNLSRLFHAVNPSSKTVSMLLQSIVSNNFG